MLNFPPRRFIFLLISAGCILLLFSSFMTECEGVSAYPELYRRSQFKCGMETSQTKSLNVIQMNVGLNAERVQIRVNEFDTNLF